MFLKGNDSTWPDLIKSTYLFYIWFKIWILLLRILKTFLDFQVIIRAKENTEIYNQDGAVGKLIGKENNYEYVRLCLQPGSKIDKHELPFPVTFFVISGLGEAFVDSETFNAESGDLLEVKANSLRGWENKSDSQLEILVMKHLQ